MNFNEITKETGQLHLLVLSNIYYTIVTQKRCHGFMLDKNQTYFLFKGKH